MIGVKRLRDVDPEALIRLGIIHLVIFDSAHFFFRELIPEKGIEPGSV